MGETNQGQSTGIQASDTSLQSSGHSQGVPAVRTAEAVSGATKRLLLGSLHLLIATLLLVGCSACGRKEQNLPSFEFRVSDLRLVDEMQSLSLQWNEECQCGDPLQWHPIGLSYIGLQKEMDLGVIGQARQIWLPAQYFDPTIPGMVRKNYWGYQVYFQEGYWNGASHKEKYMLFLHEIGHGMGLLHDEEDVNSPMYPYLGVGDGASRQSYWDQVRSFIGGLE